jgi:hypothetical protein
MPGQIIEVQGSSVLLLIPGGPVDDQERDINSELTTCGRLLEHQPASD